VRVDVNPTQLNNYGLTLSNVQAVLSTQNADLAKGQLSDGFVTADIIANDQISTPSTTSHCHRLSQRRGGPPGGRGRRHGFSPEYPLGGYLNGTPAVMIIISRQPGANIHPDRREYTQRVALSESCDPQGIDTTSFSTGQPRFGLRLRTWNHIEISVGLVIVVVFIFLRSPRATLIPSVAVPVSLIGTFSVMYLCGYSLDNLSLMALNDFDRVCRG